MFRREVLTGIVMGALVAAVFMPFGTLLWGAEVAAAVALALFASCAVATGVAMTLPWLFVRFGFDPAFGSGPLSTVIQDLLSVVISLAITVALLS